MMKDEYRHKGLRRKMLEELRVIGIVNEEVLDAINRVPRHFFLSSAFEQFAYQACTQSLFMASYYALKCP